MQNFTKYISGFTSREETQLGSQLQRPSAGIILSLFIMPIIIIIIILLMLSLIIMLILMITLIIVPLLLLLFIIR